MDQDWWLVDGLDDWSWVNADGLDNWGSMDGMDDWGGVNKWSRVHDWDTVKGVAVEIVLTLKWFKTYFLRLDDWSGVDGVNDWGSVDDWSSVNEWDTVSRKFHQKKLQKFQFFLSYALTIGAEWWTTWLDWYEVATGACTTAGAAIYPALATAKMHEATNCKWFPF